MEELADKLSKFRPKLSISPPLSVSSLLFSSSVSLFYLSATTLNMSDMLQITMCCDLKRV